MTEDYWFFLSYARIELNVYVKRFRQELAVMVRGLGGVPQPDDQKVGFLDINNLEHGRDWTADLTSALETSRILVPLFSPLYFQREYCGREYQAFLNPAAACFLGSAPVTTSRTILPVLYLPVALDEMPTDPRIRHLQLFHSSYPQLYREKGLLFLMDSPAYEAEYKAFLRAFAERVVEEAKKASTLRILGFRLMGIESIPPAFPTKQFSRGPKKPERCPAPKEHLRFVRFICGAAKDGEIKRNVAAYGAKGGIDWMPFAPGDADTGAYMAQMAALREKFLSDVKPLDPNLDKHLAESEDEQFIVVVLVDPWSLTNQSYRQWIAPCDEFKPTCAIIVAWNFEDSETKSKQLALISALQQALPIVGVAIRHPVYFRESADSRERLEAEIQSTISELYMRLLRARSAKLGFTAPPPPTVSNAHEVSIGG